MKTVATILKQLNELETELYNNFTSQEILDGFNTLEKQGISFDYTSLLNVIYTGALTDVDIKKAFQPKYKEGKNGKE